MRTFYSYLRLILASGNCHAGKGQPLLVEIEPATKRVVWTFDQYDRWGNSVSNTKILGRED
jgi:hypothetical protein